MTTPTASFAGRVVQRVGYGAPQPHHAPNTLLIPGTHLEADIAAS